jgi:hypothetical protein
VAGDVIIPWPRAILILVVVAGLCFLLGVIATMWDQRGRNLPDRGAGTWTTKTDDEDEEGRW